MNTSKYMKVLAVAAIVISSVSFATSPAKAHAFNILDPLNILPSHNILDPIGIFSGNSGSNNNNSGSNHQSSGGNHYQNPYPTTVTTPAPTSPTNITINNTNTNTNTNANVPVSTGGIAYQNPYGTYPVNNSYPTYPTSYYPSQSLNGSCYSNSTTANSGQSVIWYGAASGGNGIYSYSWNGSDGFTGYGPSISTVYYNSGTKIANVTITSAGQSISVPCSTSVIVYGNNYNTSYYGGYTNYNSYPNYGTQLNISCNANTSSASVGQSVVWSVNTSGSNYGYSYQWSGTDNLYGSGPSISTTYGTPGQKTATVTVSANGQSSTVQCVNPVNVGGQYIGNNGNGNGNLAIACAADSVRVLVGAPVTWSVEVTGGNAPYTYAWSGSGGMNGAQAKTVLEYTSIGTKSASVTVTSADGRTGSATCANNVTVVEPGTAISNTVVGRANTSPALGLSALSLFSLANIPWGWIAVLIILILLGTVIYLVFNKNKI